ncbi:HTH-type transcriptional activator IlvY [Treponema sp.]|uniref:HTH-type transcriptional activator IlvY n=1 Tax=Treponema sp. TaxID=166 RepID=UPI00257DAC55|nr:HTH-type transcriptional activator IlvY [Treponema sp.]MBE6355305.1 HTH-type transcriptional activator IlvY [Treponema sp.]
MDFFELQAFLKLSQKLHFAKAASEVNLSSSALSRLITRLEEETGSVLFDRNNREVSLTQDGIRFAEFASKCLEEKQELLFDFEHRSDEVRGMLHVFASVTACYSIMPPFIRELSEKYPHIQLSIETGDPALAIPAVKEGRAELAVAAIPYENKLEFDTVHVSRSPLVFAASCDGPFTKISGSPQDIVSSVPLILPKAGLARRRFDSWIKSRNVKPVVSAEAEGNEAVMALAALGVGIGLVPKIVLDYGPYKEGFVYHSAGNALGYYDIGFVQKAQVTGSESVRRVRAAVTEILHSLDTL